MTQAEKAQAFAGLHQKGAPLVLYNIWDAASAAAVAGAGAPAVATGSWSVAGAQGYSDGEAIPLDFLLRIVTRIVDTVDLPVSVDFEGGYEADPAGLEETVSRLIDTGAVGLNFEDQVVGGAGLYPVADQCRRIEAVRRAADAVGVPLFINARTDLFLKEQDRDRHERLLAEAVERAKHYAEAGASGFFAPALVDATLIGTLCAEVSLPCNLMMISGAPSIEDMAALGVARISYGPGPFRQAMGQVGKAAAEIYAS